MLMRKRLFVLFSALLMTILLLWSVTKESVTFAFLLYPSVDVDLNRGSGGNLEQDMLRIAMEHDSLIAKRMILPSSDGRINFKYRFFGDGAKPELLEEVSEEDAYGSEKVGGSFLIVSGDLDVRILKKTLKSLGYSVKAYKAQSYWSLALSVLIGSHRIILFLILSLTYASIVSISRMDELRSVGIRLISGGRLPAIAVKSWLRDGCEILLACVFAGLVGIVGMLIGDGGQHHLVLTLLSGIVLYGVTLFAISFILCLIYMVGVRKQGLLALIKGKRHNHAVLGILLSAQLLAFVVMSASFHSVTIAYMTLLEHRAGVDAWDQVKDRYNITITIGAQRGEEASVKWKRFVIEAIENADAMLVQHNLAKYITNPITRDGV